MLLRIWYVWLSKLDKFLIRARIVRAFCFSSALSLRARPVISSIKNIDPESSSGWQPGYVSLIYAVDCVLLPGLDLI